MRKKWLKIGDECFASLLVNLLLNDARLFLSKFVEIYCYTVVAFTSWLLLCHKSEINSAYGSEIILVFFFVLHTKLILIQGEPLSVNIKVQKVTMKNSI